MSCRVVLVPVRIAIRDPLPENLMEGGRVGTVRFPAGWLCRGFYVRKFTTCQVAHGPVFPKYTVRPPQDPHVFLQIFLQILSHFCDVKFLSGRGLSGLIAWRGVGRCTLVRGRAWWGSWFVLIPLLRWKPPAIACLTNVPSAILRHENEDPGFPSPRPGTYDKTLHRKEREYVRLFAG